MVLTEEGFSLSQLINFETENSIIGIELKFKEDADDDV